MGEVTSTSLTSCLCMLLGTACFGVGFFISYWFDFRYRPYGIGSTVHEDRYFYGLWQICHERSNKGPGDVFECSSAIESHIEPYISPLFTVVPDWYRAVQALEAIGLILTATGALCVLLFTCVKRLQFPKFLYSTLVLCSLAALFIIIGVGLFAGMVMDRTERTSGIATDKNKYNLSWGYAFTTGGGILIAIATIVLGFEARNL